MPSIDFDALEARYKADLDTLKKTDFFSDIVLPEMRTRDAALAAIDRSRFLTPPVDPTKFVGDGSQSEPEDSVAREFLDCSELKLLLQQNQSAHALWLGVPEVLGLRHGTQLYPHQKKSFRSALALLKSKAKGAILCDKHGSGKSLVALAVANTLGDNRPRRPVFIVSSLSTISEWLLEIKKFLPDTTKVFVHTTETPLPLSRMNQYQFVVTSYSAVEGEWSKIFEYVKELRKAEFEGRPHPARPTATLHASIFDKKAYSENDKISPLLILDEAHAIKDPLTHRSKAVGMLRQLFEGCLMLTATPLDDTWQDIFGLLKMIRWHPFDTITKFRNAFAEPQPDLAPESLTPGEGKHLTRLIRLLRTFMVSHGYYADLKLPPLHIHVREFDLDPIEIQTSDDTYKALTPSQLSRVEDMIVTSTRPADAKDKSFGKYVLSSQATYHPYLKNFNEFEVNASLSAMDSPEQEAQLSERAEQALSDPSANELYDECASDRVCVLLDLLLEHLGKYRDSSIVIMDEWLCWLTLLERVLPSIKGGLIGRPAIPIMRVDANMSMPVRDETFRNFDKAKEPKILLMSRAVGCEGLNIQSANVLIQTGPWWKKSMEIKAMHRIYRIGSTRECHYYQMNAREARIERHIINRRDAKHEANENVMERVVLKVGENDIMDTAQIQG